MKIALSAIKGNISDFKKLFIPDWENWKYLVDVNLSLKSSEQNNDTNNEIPGEIDEQIGQIFTITLLLHHLVAIMRQNEILQYMLKSESTAGKWHSSVSVSNPKLKVNNFQIIFSRTFIFM